MQRATEFPLSLSQFHRFRSPASLTCNWTTEAEAERKRKERRTDRRRKRRSSSRREEIEFCFLDQIEGTAADSRCSLSLSLHWIHFPSAPALAFSARVSLSRHLIPFLLISISLSRSRDLGLASNQPNAGDEGVQSSISLSLTPTQTREAIASRTPEGSA